MFWRAEQHAAAADDLPLCVFQFIGIITVIKPAAGEILRAAQPDRSQRRYAHLKTSLTNDGGIRPAQRPARHAAKFVHRLVGHTQAGRHPARCMFGIDVPVSGQQSFLLTGDHHRRKETFFKIVKGLPAAVPVDARPADHRPAVIQLPDHRPHAAAAVTTPVLHPVLDSLGLEELRSIDKQVKTARIQIHGRKVFHDLPVGRGVPLVLFHDTGKRVAVRGQRESLDRRHAGERLEAELGNIAEKIVPVIRKWFQAMPDIPVMHVTPVRTLGIIKPSAARRAGRPVECHRIFFPEHLRNHLLIHPEVVRDLLPAVDPVAFGDKLLHLVVAAPQRQRGMMAKPAYVVRDLGADVFLKGFCQVIDGTGKHEVLPDQKPKLITDVIEVIVRIISPAPYAYAVEMGGCRILQQTPGAFRAAPRQKIVLRNIIGSHGKHRHTVDTMAEALAPLIFFTPDCQGPQTDAPSPGVRRFMPVPCEDPDADIVQRLIPVSGRPPQLRIFDHDLTVFAGCPV